MKLKKLLVAEDERNLQRVYADIFAEEYEVFQALDGAEALMLAVEHVPDAMLLDIAMPLLDGRSVCGKLKGSPRTRDIKIIMVTSRADEHTRRVCLELGAEEFLDKPVDLQQLRRVLHNLFAAPAG